jgi:hypothetical protein
MANSGRSRGEEPEQPEFFNTRDETITAYAPALRDALSALPAGRG